MKDFHLKLAARQFLACLAGLVLGVVIGNQQLVAAALMGLCGGSPILFGMAALAR